MRRVIESGVHHTLHPAGLVNVRCVELPRVASACCELEWPHMICAHRGSVAHAQHESLRAAVLSSRAICVCTAVFSGSALRVRTVVFSGRAISMRAVVCIGHAFRMRTVVFSSHALRVRAAVFGGRALCKYAP